MYLWEKEILFRFWGLFVTKLPILWPSILPVGKNETQECSLQHTLKISPQLPNRWHNTNNEVITNCFTKLWKSNNSASSSFVVRKGVPYTPWRHMGGAEINVITFIHNTRRWLRWVIGFTPNNTARNHYIRSSVSYSPAVPLGLDSSLSHKENRTRSAIR